MCYYLNFKTLNLVICEGPVTSFQHLLCYSLSFHQPACGYFGSYILWGATTDAPVAISVDTAVDTRSTIGRYSMEYRSIYRSSIDRCINRYFYRSIYLVVHRDFTDTSPIPHWYFTDTSLILHRYFTDTASILHWCFTDTSPSPSVFWLISVDISVHRLVDTRPRLELLINAPLESVGASADTLVDSI